VPDRLTLRAVRPSSGSTYRSPRQGILRVLLGPRSANPPASEGSGAPEKRHAAFIGGAMKKGPKHWLSRVFLAALPQEFIG